MEAIQEGAAQPDRNFLITAHIDNMPLGSLAPGADDNASGSVGVLLAAEVLSQYNFDCTLRYVLFTGEEQGLFGSYYYAQAAANAHENFRAVLNLDMIAYDLDTQPILDLHTRINNPSDLAIASIFVDVVEAYNLDLDPHIHQDNIEYSDHASFWDFGYPAILAIEDDDNFTPYYHTINDHLDTLNLDYFTSFVQAAVGTLAHMGCLIPPDGIVEGNVSGAAGSTFLADATIEALQNEEVINSTESAGDGSYELFLPVGTYTIRASKFGFAPQTFTDVEVISDQTTTVNFSLDTCAPITSADFTFSPPIGLAGENIDFTSIVIGGAPPITISWDFDDGTLGQGETIKHTFRRQRYLSGRDDSQQL